MNKRIQELANEATEFCDIRDLTTHEYVDIPFVEKFAEKFAELIVNGCANFVEQDQGSGEVLANRLKQHFGVEE